MINRSQFSMSKLPERNCEIICGLRMTQFSSWSSGKLNTQTCELLRLDHHAWKRQEGLTNQVPRVFMFDLKLYVGPFFVACYLCVLLELPGKKKLYIYIYLFIFFQVLDQIQYHVKGNSFQMNHTVHTSYFIIRVLYYFLLFYLFVIQCCD